MVLNSQFSNRFALSFLVLFSFKIYFFSFFPGGMHSQFLTNMFNQSRWKAKAGGYCELMCLHMVHLGLSSRADSRLRSGLHKIKFCCPKRADEMSLLGDAGLLPWLGEEIVFSRDYLLSHYSP